MAIYTNENLPKSKKIVKVGLKFAKFKTKWLGQ